MAPTLFSISSGIQGHTETGSHWSDTTRRRDIHSLFDAGYVTVTPDLHFEVSRRIKEEFDNGKHYYALQGQLISTPKELGQRPDPAALSWHNERCFRG